MRSLSPSRIFVCTSTVSPIAKSATSAFSTGFSTISRICWLMVLSLFHSASCLNNHEEHKDHEGDRSFLRVLCDLCGEDLYIRSPLSRILAQQVGPALSRAI